MLDAHETEEMSLGALRKLPGGDRILIAMSDGRFPEVIHRLQRGVHVGPEDGMLHAFLEEQYVGVCDFLALWGGDLIRSADGYCHLIPSDRYHGVSQLTRHDMLVGMALAQLRTDPTLIGRGVSIPDLAIRIQRSCGGEDAYLRVMVNRRRAGTTAGQLDKALEIITRSLRRLSVLGFCEIDEDPVRGAMIKPRLAAMRFAEPAKMAGGDERQLRADLRDMAEAKRSAPTTAEQDDLDEEGEAL